jgi:hypothetical protein
MLGHPAMTCMVAIKQGVAMHQPGYYESIYPHMGWFEARMQNTAGIRPASQSIYSNTAGIAITCQQRSPTRAHVQGLHLAVSHSDSGCHTAARAAT